MRIDILTRNDLPYTYENYAAKRLKKELETAGISCRHIDSMGNYLHEVRQSPPDWTVAFNDLLGWEKPLCDILKVPHFHWEQNSIHGLEHLQQSAHCEIGFHQEHEGIHQLPLPVDAVEPQKKLFETILFLDLNEETRSFVERFESRVDIFGDHKGPNWLVRLKNREHVYLHMPLPFTEKLRVLAMSRFVIMKEDDPLYPYAILANCLPVQEITSEESRLYKLERLTKKVLQEHSWHKSTQALLNTLFR